MPNLIVSLKLWKIPYLCGLTNLISSNNLCKACFSCNCEVCFISCLFCFSAGCDILRRVQKPFRYRYPIPPGSTYFQHGLLFRGRIEQKNPFCNLNGLVWRRGNLFRPPTNNEPWVTPVNVMDPNATLLPQFDEAHLNCINLGT